MEPRVEKVYVKGRLWLLCSDIDNICMERLKAMVARHWEEQKALEQKQFERIRKLLAGYQEPNPDEQNHEREE